MYAVVNSKGEFKKGRCGLAYVRRKAAEKAASAPGDSVVELVWDTDREPCYVKGRTLGE